MEINADFSERVVVHSNELDWIPSPMAGVSRRPLDRVGGEVARATTIVKYDPDSHFSPHVHTGGEEFIVLEGVFQDEHGDFPAGSYIRNPPQSKHQPRSEPGCVIFVKLWQFDMEDRSHVRMRMDHMPPVPHRAFDGVAITPLFSDAVEDVFILTLDPNTPHAVEAPGGVEALVLSGEASESSEFLQKDSWIRIPAGSQMNLTAGSEGVRLWIKTGHLGRVDEEVARVNALQ